MSQGNPASAIASGTRYTVVARRYRPKSFADLVGQDTVAQALSTAIRTNRVGHAYLFTGARGVGKTSTARIFAKALNAPGGPNPEPDLDSDVAQAIDTGEDMDVIEIDGASNRGIEEIRQLRANVHVRPSRSTFKIYIIDEVHMLTTPAFNALLKTLEEPPPHVKFLFCTTDPEKIPITVLSRCQRFDFSPVKTDQILQRLKFICQSEGAQATEEALRVIARRAAGSMRDSQSLLEQILSFSDGNITLDHVHQMLGTADETRLASIAQHLLARQAGMALHDVDQAVSDGIDAGQLAEQLLGYLRDIMALTAGASAEIVRTANPNSAPELQQCGRSWGLTTLLSAVQVLDEAIVKMRYSVQARILLEVALVQICQLQDLQRLSELLATMQPLSDAPPPRSPAASTSIRPLSNSPAANSTTSKSPTNPAPTNPAPSNPAPANPAPESVAPTTPTEKKNAEPHDQVTAHPEATAIRPGPARPSQGPSDLQAAWRQTLSQIEGIIGDYAALATRIEEKTPDVLQLVFPSGCELAIEACERSENRSVLQQALSLQLGRPVQLAMVASQEPTRTTPTTSPTRRPPSRSQQFRELREVPLIVRICELFGGEVVRVDAPAQVNPAPHAAAARQTTTEPH
jgi:DNA polymerase-3 subunit gamma/tau